MSSPNTFGASSRGLHTQWARQKLRYAASLAEQGMRMLLVRTPADQGGRRDSSERIPREPRSEMMSLSLLRTSFSKGFFF